MELAPAPSSVMAAGDVKLVSRMSPGLAFGDEADTTGRAAEPDKLDQHAVTRTAASASTAGAKKRRFTGSPPQESSDSDPDY